MEPEQTLEPFQGSPFPPPPNFQPLTGLSLSFTKQETNCLGSKSASAMTVCMTLGWSLNLSGPQGSSFVEFCDSNLCLIGVPCQSREMMSVRGTLLRRELRQEGRPRSHGVGGECSETDMQCIMGSWEVGRGASVWEPRLLERYHLLELPDHCRLLCSCWKRTHPSSRARSLPMCWPRPLFLLGIHGETAKTWCPPAGLPSTWGSGVHPSDYTLEPSVPGLG